MGVVYIATPHHLFPENLQQLSNFKCVCQIKLHLANKFRNRSGKNTEEKNDITNVHKLRCPGIVSLETRLRTGKSCNQQQCL